MTKTEYHLSICWRSFLVLALKVGVFVGLGLESVPVAGTCFIAYFIYSGLYIAYVFPALGLGAGIGTIVGSLGGGFVGLFIAFMYWVFAATIAPLVSIILFIWHLLCFFFSLGSGESYTHSSSVSTYNESHTSVSIGSIFLKILGAVFIFCALACLYVFCLGSFLVEKYALNFKDEGVAYDIFMDKLCLFSECDRDAPYFNGRMRWRFRFGSTCINRYYYLIRWSEPTEAEDSAESWMIKCYYRHVHADYAQWYYDLFRKSLLNRDTSSSNRYRASWYLQKCIKERCDRKGGYLSDQDAHWCLVKANKWFSRAIDKDHSMDERILYAEYAYMLYYGAANASNRHAYRGECRRQIGRLYELASRNEVGYPSYASMDDAVKYYRLAIADGDSQAQYVLAHYYYNGLGVKMDRAEAIRLFRAAAANGHRGADSFLRKLGVKP